MVVAVGVRGRPSCVIENPPRRGLLTALAARDDWHVSTAKFFHTPTRPLCVTLTTNNIFYTHSISFYKT